jgi:hypothetical protein
MKKLAVLTMILLLAARVLCAADKFNVRQFGAVGDGKTMDTAALQKAIDAAAQAGGGEVVFPAGRYLSGSLELKSRVTLRLEAGATLLGSAHRMDYRKVNFHGLVLADQQEDIGICGQGAIDGQGTALATDTENLRKKGQLPKSDESERPVLINFRDCKNVVVRDVTLRDSACWVEDYRDCENLRLENITVRSLAAYNNDGIDVDGCVHAVVRGCDIDSEDDGICLKSGDRACEDVLVENCRLRSSCNGLKFGTSSHGGFKNVLCRHLNIYDTYISAIALEIVDGGEMANVRICDIKITDCGNPLFVRLGHRNVHGEIGSVHGVTISNVTAQIPDRPAEQLNKFPVLEGWKHNTRSTLLTAAIIGLPGHPVRDVAIEDMTIVYGGIGKADRPGQPDLDSLAKVPERTSDYPEVSKFGTLPAWGFYCRHAEGIRFSNVTLRAQGSDYRPALLCDDARDLALDGVHVLSGESGGSEPVIVFNDVQGATIRNSTAPAGTTRLIKQMGNTRDVKGE